MVLESANLLECLRSIFCLNNFISFEKHQKKPSKRSPRKKVKMAGCSQQQDDKQQDLCETDDNIRLGDSPVDFEKKKQPRRGITDKASLTDGFSNIQ